jgi:hypothetical protein
VTPVIRDDKRRELELLAFQLELHGAIALKSPVIRRLARSGVFLELRILLREYGLQEGEISQLMGRHPSGCPCWTCVLRLNRWVRAHHRKLKEKAGTRRRPLIS